MPGLVWNTMLSMSGGWFFVVASEAITLGDNTWKLPGIGSYVAAALEARDIGAVFWAIGAMLAGDPGLRPVAVPPAGRLVGASSASRRPPRATAEDPWVLALLRRTHVLRVAGEAVGDGFGR